MVAVVADDVAAAVFAAGDWSTCLAAAVVAAVRCCPSAVGRAALVSWVSVL